MKLIYFAFALLIIASSFAIVAGQSDSPKPKIISCEGHRQLDQIYYDVYFINQGKVKSNFHIDDRYSKTVYPGEKAMITVFYPLPLEQHHHSIKAKICTGGYLSFEQCDSITCTYTEGKAPELDTGKLFDTSKLEKTCSAAFLILCFGGALFLRRF